MVRAAGRRRSAVPGADDPEEHPEGGPLSGAAAKAVRATATISRVKSRAETDIFLAFMMAPILSSSALRLKALVSGRIRARASSMRRSAEA